VQGPQLLISFTAAGALTWAAVRFVHWRTHGREVPVVWGAGWARALATGLLVGCLAAAAGILYLQAVQALGLLDEVAARTVETDPRARTPWLLPRILLAAPLFEEYIFRGLVFGGLRRSMRLLPAAVASAAIFAIVHPPLSMLPVFALAICAAWACERSGLLLAPMVVHMVYNGAVVGWHGWALAALG
jgi:membrane protease YdiL (CAAX protease family)